MNITLEFTDQALLDFQLAIATRQTTGEIFPESDPADLVLTAIAAVAYLGKDATVTIPTTDQFTSRLATAKAK